MKKKKIAVSLILFLVLLALIGGGIGFLAGKGILGSYLDPKGNFLKALIGSLTFQGGMYAILGGAMAYVGVLAFLLDVIVAIAKKDGHYLWNAFSALLAFALSASACALLTLNNGIEGTKGIVGIIGAAVFAVYGLVAFLFGVIFPKKEEKALEPKPIPVEIEPSEEPEEEIAQQEAKAEEAKEEPQKPEEEPKKVEAAEEAEVAAEPKPAEEETKPAEEEAKAEEGKAEEEPAPKEEPEPNEEPKKEKAKAKPAEKAAEEKSEAAPEEAKQKVLGKYEVFPEAGFYKYRLKANNGEILIVSQGYKTAKSAIAGIDTFKKNAESGAPKVIVDKNGFAQWRLFTGNDARLIAAGEIYPNEKSANSALNSMLRFYQNEKIVTLDEIPEEEHREWTVELPEPSKSENGKIEIAQQDAKWVGSLRANNGQLLFQTATYASRNGLLSGIEKIKAAVEKGSITIARDKQNRFQFRVFAENGMVLVMGETYPSKERAVSAANSTRNFLPSAKLVEAAKPEGKAE